MNNSDVQMKPPEPISDIAIRRFPKNPILDIFVETDIAFNRIMSEAPRYGKVSQGDDWDFIRLFVAPTFDVNQVAAYLERKVD
jgi:hypothetical protein